MTFDISKKGKLMYDAAIENILYTHNITAHEKRELG